jgi:hypothetical protein
LDLAKSKTLDYKFVKLSKHEAVKNQGFRINDQPAFVTRFVLTSKFGEKEVFENMHAQTASNISNSLNSFLGSNQKSFSYTYDERFVIYYPVSWGAWGELFLTVIFCVIVFFMSWRSFIYLIDNGEEVLINKSEATLKHTKTNFLGIRKVNHYFFAAIAKVDVVYATDSYDKVSFVPRIILHFGEQFRLDKLSDRQAAIAIANDLNRFMGLPEEEDPIVKE